MNETKILFASSEVAPFAKTGGLADVSGSLPKALQKLRADIRIVMPKYKNIPQNYIDKMKNMGYIYVDVGWRHQYCGLFRLETDNVIVYFIDNEYYFSRDGLYGYTDEAERFTFFTKALIEMLPLLDFKPDIIHCNDWQTGIVSVLLKSHYMHIDFYKDIKTVLTIHNLKYQGIFSKSIIDDLLGLSWEYFTENGVEFYGCVNFLKAGLIFSDAINTVSKTYSEEIRNEYFGENLSNVIKKRSSDLYGILNGIDYDENNPATDSRLYANYDAEHLEGKHINKKNLQESLGLPAAGDTPVIGIISRLVDQKGFDLIEHILKDILMENVQLVVLGSGEQKYESLFENAAAAHPDKVSCSLRYDTVLAQKIYAGSDMFLMPSLFEPCGLSQMFSLRYGTIPIVRETGGLKDTVQPYNEYTGEGNGFSFTNYNADDLLYTIRRAIHFYYDSKVWNGLIRRGMKQDFSWNKSADEYMDLYRKVISR